MAIAVVVHLNGQARLRNFREFAATASRTLQLETCGGIKPANLHEYLCALASAMRTQAMLRDIDLRPGEFKGVVTDAIDSAYLLKRDESNQEVARGVLTLFANCLDPIMSRTLSGDASQRDEEHFVGTAGALVLLANVGWHPEANADLVTCALSETSLPKDVAEYWRTRDRAHQDRVESAFERVVRTALDPATAAHVRHKLFSDLNDDARTAA
jgi:hypothetical protein